MLNISADKIEEINVPDYGYELLAEFELEKEFETEDKNNEKIA